MATIQGLTAEQVAERVALGQTNDVPGRAARSVSDIVRANVFTRINAILGVLLLIVLMTGSVINGAFGLLIIANSAIGIIQELRAKRTLDELAIVGQAKPIVRRADAATALAPNEVVLDDIIELGPGDQIVVDGEVIEESALEVDESLLTGEADSIEKNIGAQVLSGSFVVAGSGAYRATKVGLEAYAAKLAEEASKFTLVHSELRNGIDKILQFITYLLVPAGLLIIYTQLFTVDTRWRHVVRTGPGVHEWLDWILRLVGSMRQSILGMVAALVPMVPEGLVLMTSIAFAVGVIRLGRRQCLVQELPAIEGLARVDTVCADKTGTLTENGMRLAELRQLHDRVQETLAALAQLAADDRRPNASIAAIAEAYDTAPGWNSTAVAPFSSAKKWSGSSYGQHGNWVIGAPDVLLDSADPIAGEAEQIGAEGMRVLLLASTELPVDDARAPGAVTPRGLVVLEQKVRSDARETLDYFASQHVSIKVISGDNAVSVAAVAGVLGLSGATVDARTLPTDNEQLAEVLADATTFGRVRPDQKRAMVTALQSRGHTVAMTGDGVNDVLALKDADIGVAMGAGSSAARAVAQIVLLDNKFATLPYVVGEGRRVIGNIERVSNLFLTKTVYSVLLALAVGLAGLGSSIFHYGSVPFPFQPIHVTIAAWFTIGVPAFILSLAPNNERAQSDFVRRVMLSAIPSGLTVGLCTFVSYLLARRILHVTEGNVQASTAALITELVVAWWVLAVVARPYQWWRLALVAVSGMAYVVIFSIPLAQKEFMLDPSNFAVLGPALAVGVAGAAIIEVLWWLQGRWTGRPRHFWANKDD